MSGEPYEYRDALIHQPRKGRGAGLNPGNRYEATRLHVLGDHLDHLAREIETEGPNGTTVKTTVLPDRSQTIINKVDSPDLFMKWTVNPYRGCEHGCIYCYARPDHERLGFSSGLDFETRIIAKFTAPDLLRKELAKPRWRGEPIVMSGVTDPYQPIERKLRITRRCMEIFADCRQPISIITKNKLILRDLDLLTTLAAHRAVHVAVSITTLDRELAMKMEPRAAAPTERFKTVRTLAEAGIPVHVMVAPIIPGLTDREVPAILQAVAEAGASSAGYVMLRLPHQIKALFLDWLARHFPERAAHIESLIRQMRGGELYDATWRNRHKGSGPIAEQTRNIFHVFAKRYGLDRGGSKLSSADFRRPTDPQQPTLFG